MERPGSAASPFRGHCFCSSWAWELETAAGYLLLAIWGGQEAPDGCHQSSSLHRRRSECFIWPGGLAMGSRWRPPPALNTQPWRARISARRFEAAGPTPAFLIAFGGGNADRAAATPGCLTPTAKADRARAHVGLAGILLKMGGYCPCCASNVQLLPAAHAPVCAVAGGSGVVNIIYAALTSFGPAHRFKRKSPTARSGHMGFVAVIGIGSFSALGTKRAMLRWSAMA